MASKGFRSAMARRGTALGLAALLVTATVGSLVLRAAGRATASGTSGYWVAGLDGGVFNYGLAPFHGSAGSAPLNSPVVGFVPSPSAQGYWMVASDGGVFAFGDATFHGSMAGEGLSKPIVDFARTPSGQGYWMTTSDGQVYGFGDAPYYGSVGAVDLNKRIEALVPTPTGKGYWLAAADGGIFAFGDAPHLGAAAGQTDKRVIDMAATATGRGYYLVTSNGLIFPYGDATAYGSPSDTDLNSRIVAMATVIPAPGSGLEAVEDAVTGDEDVALSIDPLANDKAPSGGATLTLQGITPPGRGTASVAGNRVNYIPAAEYHGPDSFTYTVASSNGGTATGTVRLTVAPVDDKPEALDDKINITDGAPATIDVVLNDRGLGDGLKAVLVTKEPAHGTASVGPDNRIGYTPAGGFNGTDRFDYRIVDSDDDTSSTGKVEVTIGGANHLPVAADDEVTLRSGRDYTVNVTGNDDVADGVKEVRFADTAGAPIDSVDIGTNAGGAARRNGSKITYTAPAGSFTGEDSFRYVVVDSGGDVSSPAVVRATVVRNQPPQVKDGTVAVPHNRQAVGSIAKLGWDPEKDSITFVLRSSPAGQLTLKPDGSFVYQAPSGVDVDNFTFVASDGNSDSNEGQLRIQITDAAAPSSSTTATTGRSSASTSGSSASTSSTTGPSTTTTTRKSSTTSTTARSSTTSTTGPEATTDSTAKPSGKSKKQSNSSNNRGKPTKSKSKR